MKKAFIYAYDHINLGDDLFVRALVNRYPMVQFFLWSDQKNISVFQDCKNLKIIDKNSRYVKFLTKIRPSLAARYQEKWKVKSDAVIYIGGSIFMEYPTWENIVNWWNYQTQHYKFYVLGANFGPYQTEAYRESMGAMMNGLQDVCFRDRYSYELFCKDVKTVRQAPDILFGYPMPQIRQKKKQIYISVINCAKKEDGKFLRFKKQYESIIEKMIQSFLEDGYKIKLVSFCREEGDEETVKDLADRFENHRRRREIQQLNYDGRNQEVILEELAASEYVIATRFHAIVLGLAAEQNVYPVIYSDKSKNMLKDIGFLGEYLDIRSMNDFDLEKMKQERKRNNRINFSSIRLESQRHFEVLDHEFL